MGGGASSQIKGTEDTAKSPSSVPASSLEGNVQVVPLATLAKSLHVYQSNADGRILLLVDVNVYGADRSIVGDPSTWNEVYLAQESVAYFASSNKAICAMNEAIMTNR
jgi:hypothetical protein